MIPRNLRSAYIILTSPLVKMNSFLYKTFFSPNKTSKDNFVQLGPGTGNYLPGWINVDHNIISAKLDVWSNISYDLPFKSSSIDAFYSHHVVEHLPDLKFHMKEIYRCLKPGGIYRVGGPNGDIAIQKFVEKDYDWFMDFPEKRKSIGGRFENFIFCKGEHLTILTYSMLEEIMTDIGFKEIQLMKPNKESSRKDIFKKCLEIEWVRDSNAPHTILIEATK